MRSSALLCLLVCGIASAAAPPKVAAPGLRAIGMDPMFVEFLNEQLANGLRSSGLQVITSNEIKSLIGLERQRQLLGCRETDSSCMAEVSGALGVDVLAMGDVVQLDKRFQVSLKMVSAVDGRVLAFESTRVDNKEGMADAAVNAGKRMGLRLRGTVVPQAEAPAEDAGTPEVASASSAATCPKGQWCKVAQRARYVSDGKGAYDLLGLYGSGADNLWAVGYGATVLHWDGKSWQERHAPSEGGGVLRTAWSPNPNLAYVAGQNGVAYKWKGQGWVTLTDPNYATFYALSGTPDGKQVWAATDKGLLRLEAGEWRTQWAEATVRDVVILSADDGWAVAKDKLLRYRKGRWTEVKGAPKEDLNAVFATGPNDLWFGGDNVILQHNPTKKAWKRYKLGGRASVLSLWGTSPEDLWAAATYGVLAHFDGEDWVNVPVPGGGTLFGVTGSGKDDIWFLQGLPEVRTGTAVYHYKRTP